MQRDKRIIIDTLTMGNDTSITSKGCKRRRVAQAWLRGCFYSARYPHATTGHKWSSPIPALARATATRGSGGDVCYHLDCKNQLWNLIL